MAADGDRALDRMTADVLAPIVARALNCDRVEVTEWRWQPIAYDVYLPNRQLVQVTGRAEAGGAVRDWTVVLKLSRPDDRLTPQNREKQEREVLAYESGLLADLPGGLAAPRVLAIDRPADGAVWLWLEHLVDAYAGRWTPDQFRQAAYDLGAFNGAYLGERPLPEAAWLTRQWPELHSEAAKIPAALAEIVRLVEDPRVHAAFAPEEVRQMPGLLRDQVSFKAALSRLPVVLCHHDASQANLFARHRADGAAETVAIDWESVGHGTFGADIATLVFGTIRRGLFQADDVHVLDSAVFDGYLAGLRAAGWRGDPALVRLGYTASIALRWFQLHSALRRLTDPGIRSFRGSKPEPEAEAARQFMLLTSYLLACAEAARGLIKRVGL